jgi:hypothetical protein
MTGSARAPIRSPLGDLFLGHLDDQTRDATFHFLVRGKVHPGGEGLGEVLGQTPGFGRAAKTRQVRWVLQRVYALAARNRGAISRVLQVLRIDSR